MPAGTWSIATNQSGLGRGLFDVASLNAMHAKMHKMLAAQRRAHRRGVLLPAQRPTKAASAASRCPGLFEQIGERFGVDLTDVPVVGDALRDLQAGAAAGCEPHLVLHRQGRALDAAQLLPRCWPVRARGCTTTSPPSPTA